jgi:hypothetical protein
VSGIRTRIEPSDLQPRFISRFLDPKVYDAALLRLIHRRYDCSEAQGQSVLKAIHSEFEASFLFDPTDDAELHPTEATQLNIDVCAARVGVVPPAPPPGASPPQGKSSGRAA